MAASLRASSQGLELVDQARRKKGWSKTAAAWCDLAMTSTTTLKRFWSRSPIQQETFISICQAVGVDWEGVVEIEQANVSENAAQECISLIEQGVSVWNRWWKTNHRNEITLNGAELKGADLRGIDFRGISLKGADLRGSNLSNAILSEANLANADFSQANLSNADLSRVQALATNFTEARLTGVCIEDWNLNNVTKLTGVICDYVFLKIGHQERRPSDGNFAPGEFTKLFQRVLETIDLVFANGIDWKAFFLSFQKLQTEYGDDNLSLQAIEKKGGGAFVIRLEVPPEVNKSLIERHTKELYESNLKYLESRYHSELKTKSQEIESYRQQNADLMQIVKLLASQSTNNKTIEGVEASSSNKFVYDFRGASIGHFANELGRQNRLNYHISEQKDLAEAAAEIQALLKQLEQVNPTATVAEQESFIRDTMPPTLKNRLLKALESGGEEAFKQLMQHPATALTIKALKDWHREESKNSN